jgi:MFS family permease
MASQQETDNKPAGPVDVHAELKGITPEMDRTNGSIFFISYLLIYFAAPVVYVGVVQAALCDKLGANATIANLPGSAYLFGNFAPLIFSAVVPHRLERAVVVWANIITAILLSMVCTTLLLPFENSVRIAALIGQGLIQGFTGSTSQVFMLQCLGRGTTLEGRAKAFKLAYGAGPIAAVGGSLSAQFVLNRGIPFLDYPYDFALLYLMGVACTAGVAFVCRRFVLIPVREEEHQPFFDSLLDSVKSYFRVKSLVVLWLAYALWNSTLSAMPNLSLYTKEAIGREPKELSGLIMALRFGFKSLAGYFLGVITLRWGIRAPLTTTIALAGGAGLWGWMAPGYFYLLSFGLMGAGELGGAYFPNYSVAVSSAERGARNLALLTLATPVASLSAVLHGALTDLYGFSASFVFGITTALLALWLVFKLPSEGRNLARLTPKE